MLLYLTLEVLLFHLNMKKRLAIWLWDEPIYVMTLPKWAWTPAESITWTLYVVDLQINLVCLYDEK